MNAVELSMKIKEIDKGRFAKITDAFILKNACSQCDWFNL